MAVTRDKSILCLYDADGHGAKILLDRFNIQWLTNGKGSLGGECWFFASDSSEAVKSLSTGVRKSSLRRGTIDVFMQ